MGRGREDREYIKYIVVAIIVLVFVLFALYAVFFGRGESMETDEVKNIIEMKQPLIHFKNIASL